MIDKAQISHMLVQPCKVLCNMSPSIHSYNMNISSFRHLLERMKTLRIISVCSTFILYFQDEFCGVLHFPELCVFLVSQ